MSFTFEGPKNRHTVPRRWTPSHPASLIRRTLMHPDTQHNNIIIADISINWTCHCWGRGRIWRLPSTQAKQFRPQQCLSRVCFLKL